MSRHSNETSGGRSSSCTSFTGNKHKRDNPYPRDDANKSSPKMYRHSNNSRRLYRGLKRDIDSEGEKSDSLHNSYNKS